MNAAQVIDHFDRICDAPDAIPRLRRFILDLAVRGKLVEQDPNDEPASELLKRIRARKGDWSKKDRSEDRQRNRWHSQKTMPFELPNLGNGQARQTSASIDYRAAPKSKQIIRQRYADLSLRRVRSAADISDMTSSYSEATISRN